MVRRESAKLLFSGSIPLVASKRERLNIDIANAFTLWYNIHMNIGKKKKWTEQQLRDAAKKSHSVRQVINYLGLIPAGGNYVQVQKYLKLLKINTGHFKGKAWNKGLTGIARDKIPLEKIMVADSSYQSHKLKIRLFADGIKTRKCEKCGWAKKSADGRIPLELDHINGKHSDNRLINLRILCPNCHSLQPTHRSKNRKKVV